MNVRKAIVLAAGLGTRLRPFTCVTPKPLLPVWGEPMLARIVALLRARGVDDIVVNAHYLPDGVRAWVDGYVRAARAAGDAVSMRVSYEPEILGTGGVLNPLRTWIGDEPFYLVNGDIVLEDPPDLAAAFARAGDDTIALAAVTEQGPRTLEVEPASRFVTNWKSDEAGVAGTYTYAGFTLIKPQILQYVRETGFSTIVEAFEKAMFDGRFVRTVTSEDFLWEDAGTVARYIAVNQSGDENAFAEMPQVAAALKALALEPTAPVTFLGARGSERVFFRCPKGIVILYDDATRTENALYAEDARWLKGKGLRVPDVLADLPAEKVLVLADAGVERKMTLEQYVRVVEELARFNQLGTADDLPKLMPPFDAALWQWERDLFAEHCLGTRFCRPMPDDVRRELENVAALLAREPKALVHRDFQSTNVLWRGEDFQFIDFQGMRLGPAAYDLASLVYDPYVTLSAGERRALVALYARKSNREDIVKILPHAAVQRLVQCLGAYGRLASVGQPQFGQWVLPALVNLLDAADAAGLDAVGALAEDLIAAERKLARPRAHACACGHHHSHHHGA